MENRHLRMFIAIKIVSRVVRPPCLFLRIPTDPKTSTKANLNSKDDPTFSRPLQVQSSRFQGSNFWDFRSNFHAKSLKSCSLENVKVGFEVREKKFRTSLEFQNLLSQTSLGPWVSAETNGVAVRRVKQFLSQ